VRTKELPRECATNTIWQLRGDAHLKDAEICKSVKDCAKDTAVLMISVNGVQRMTAQTLLKREGSVILMVINVNNAQCMDVQTKIRKEEYAILMGQNPLNVK